MPAPAPFQNLTASALSHTGRTTLQIDVTWDDPSSKSVRVALLTIRAATNGFAKLTLGGEPGWVVGDVIHLVGGNLTLHTGTHTITAKIGVDQTGIGS